MINIKVVLNNIPSNINVRAVTSDISEVIEKLTGQNVNVNLNMQDNNSTSPLGLYLTQDYMKLRNRI